MSGQLFEIAFSGQIAEGADLQTVKQHIGKIFKADENRLQQLFSGKRNIIKRQVDEATAAKYKGAFQKAGAICEVTPLGQPEPQVAATPAATPTAAPAVPAEEYVSRYSESEQIPQALLTEPLGVKANEIEDLAVDLAPVGSQMQHQIKEVSEPDIDTSGIEVAPVGAVLNDGKKDDVPPPPDTSGLSMAD